MSATRPPPLDLGNEKVSEREHVNSSLTPGRVPLPARASTPMSSTEVPVLGYGEAQARRQPQATPLQSPDPGHVQFASYRADKSEWAGAPQGQNDDNIEKFKSWTPLPLRVWFWLIYVVILVGGAIALEIALHYNRKDNGWGTTAGFSSQSGVLHYAYTLPSVIISMVITSIWAWTDIEIKKMQPYVDLVHGDAPPQTSLLLDYTRTNNFLVWTRAMRNKHYVVTLSTLMVILSLCFSPLSASLFTVRDTYLAQPSTFVNSLYEISLNQGDAFRDLTAFVTAAGYASAAELYGLGPPPWTHDGYAVAPVDIPEELRQNGTMNVVTNAVLSKPNCHEPDIPVARTKDAAGNGTWHNTAVYKGCSYTWSVNKTTEDLFGLDALGATNFTNGQATGDGCKQFQSMPPENQPIVLWYFTYRTTTANSSVAICEPTIELWKVNATVDLSTRNLTFVQPIRALTSDDAGTSLSANVTGPPLNGQAYNGAAFDPRLFTLGDPFVAMRATATTLQLPAAVMQAARDSPGSIVGAFESDAFVPLSSRIYEMYLQVFAQNIYFLQKTDTLDADIVAWRLRLWLSDVAVHLIAAALLILAFFGSIVQILHRGDRSDLRLGHAPGTIASAVALGGQTDVGAVLAGRQGEDDIQQALADKRFRMDPRTHKIVMEGETGYEDAKSPDPRRGSMFVMLQRGLSTRGPRSVGTPPRTPMERVSDSS